MSSLSADRRKVWFLLLGLILAIQYRTKSVFEKFSYRPQSLSEGGWLIVNVSGQGTMVLLVHHICLDFSSPLYPLLWPQLRRLEGHIALGSFVLPFV